MTGSQEKQSTPIESPASPVDPAAVAGIDDPPAPATTASDSSSTRPELGAPDEIDAVADAPPEPRKKGAGEAFQDLSDSVHLLASRFDEVGDFVRICKEKLLHEAEVYRHDGAKPFLEVLM